MDLGKVKDWCDLTYFRTLGDSWFLLYGQLGNAQGTILVPFMFFCAGFKRWGFVFLVGGEGGVLLWGFG